MPSVTKRKRTPALSDCSPESLGSATAPAIVDRANSSIKLIPRSRAVREQIRRHAEDAARQFDASRLIDKDDLEQAARGVLTDLHQPEAFLGWTMVMLASAIWREQAMGAEFSQRLLLLPGTLAKSSQFAIRAKQLGYHIVPVEDTQAILEALFGGQIDAIVGLASLDVLEKAIDHILWFGLPCVGLPLLEQGCIAESDEILANSATLAFDADWLGEMIELPHVPADRSPPTYIHLLRTSNGIFEPDELERWRRGDMAARISRR